MENEREIEPQLNTKDAKELYKALTSISNEKDMALFLRDLLTIEEIEEAIRRFRVARLLEDGKTFREIADQTRMSTATIARINYWLNHGTGGYRKALEKIT